MNRKSFGRRTRRSHTAAFEAKVALTARRDEKTMAELCKEFELHPTRISEWKSQLLDRAVVVFSAGSLTRAGRWPRCTPRSVSARSSHP